jgi:hypothetical protein
MKTYRKIFNGKWQSSLLAFFLVFFSCSASLSFNVPLERGPEDPEELTSFKEVYGMGENGGNASIANYMSAGSAVPLSFMQPDSTQPGDFDFSEKDGESHLARDILVFTIVSVFVAYFLIKVFLQGDTEEEKPPDNGKPLPGYAITITP